MTTRGKEIGGAAAAWPRRGDGTREGWKEEGAWRVGGSALTPRVCWVCRLGQAGGCSSAFPSLPCRSGSGAGAQPRALGGGSPLPSARPGVFPLCPLGSEGLLADKAPPGLEKPNHPRDGSWGSGSRLGAAFSLVLRNSPGETISSAPKP